MTPSTPKKTLTAKLFYVAINYLAPHPPCIYEIHLVLVNTYPQIERTILVSSQTTLAELHNIIQITMGWEDAHLHLFAIQNKQYGTVDNTGLDPSIIAETKPILADFKLKIQDTFRYIYNFSANWKHDLTIKNIHPISSKKYPLCIKAKYACPPEFINGAVDYLDFLEIINNKYHPKHQELQKKIGIQFKPQNFNIAEINTILQQTLPPQPTKEKFAQILKTHLR